MSIASSFMSQAKSMASSAATTMLPKVAKQFAGLLKKELTAPDFSTKYSTQQQQDIWNAITEVCSVKQSEKLSSRFTRVMKKGLFGSQGGRRTRRRGGKVRTAKRARKAGRKSRRH
jgi:hypothetical protein